MSGDLPPLIQGLTTCAVTVGYRLDQTVLDVWRPEQPRPVARLAKNGPIRARAAYQLFVGPELNQVAGQVSPSGALDVTGAPVGLVNLSGGRVADGDIHPMSGARHSYVVHNPAQWRIVQTGLPLLTGEAVGRATRMCFNRLTDLGERTGFELPTPDFLVTLHFRYGAPESPGFAVKVSQRKARFDVTIEDPRIDRRLVFACLTAMAALLMWNPKREAVDMASPFRHR